MRRSPAACLSSSRFSLTILCLVILSSVSFAASPDRISGPIVSSQTVKVGGAMPLQARHATDEGRVDPSLTMSYITLLTTPSAAQQKELNALYLSQQNPHSASFRKWLTPEQYADRFGLSNNDLNKITTWLQSQGFTIVRTARGRNFVVFSGPAALVERAFQTEIHSFTANGETHFANVTPASIPAALSGIVTGFHGLNNFRPKSQAQRGNPSYTYLYKGNDYYFVAPGDITAMYDVSTLQGLDGTGQSLAVVGETGIYQSDLTNFRQNFGLSAISCTTSSDVITSCNTSNFKYVLVNGSANSISLNDLPESDLDLEWSGATAPKAQVIFVNSTDPNGDGVWDSWYYAVDNTVAKVITMSYTAPCEYEEAVTPDGEGTIKPNEGTFASDEAELLQANTEGITFLNSAGDTGAAECDYGNNFAIYGYAAAYPASSQYVTGVGGTSIPSISPNEYSSTYWNSSNGTAGASVKGYVPEQPWNDAQEFGLICTANPSDGFCTFYGVTDWETAQEAVSNGQNVIGISAGGGGVSNCVTLDANGVCLSGFPQPSWQSGISASAINPSGFGVTSTPARYSPDISLLASPNFPGYLTCTQEAALGGSGSGSTCDSPTTGISDMLGACLAGTNACSIFGGTSVSSPVFAGMVTLLNQYLDVNGLGNINSTLYTLAAANATNQAFHPVTTASTGSYSDGAFCQEGSPDSGLPGDPWPASLQCPSSGANAGFLGFNSFNADPTTGYNLVTGLGSVDADKLAVAWKTSLQTGFTLAASPTSVSISQGGAAGTSTITVTDLNGFTGAVTLAASNVPTGVTATFGTNPTTTTSILSLTASGSATPGTTTITITGTSGSSTATTTVSLTVTAGPSFSLSANPTSLTITPTLAGKTSVITVTDAGGFTGNVTLAATGLPTGVTAAFSPNPTASTSTLTLTAGAGASAGNATVTITGTSGALTATTTIALTVTPAPSFTLASSGGVTLTPGITNSGTSTITVTELNGFTGNVTLAASGLSSGVTAAFSPNPTTTTSTLTLTANGTATPGTVTVTITGTSGALSATTTVALTVNQNFTLSAPTTPATVLSGESTTSTFNVTANNGSTFTTPVTFACNGLPDATVSCSFSSIAQGATSPQAVMLTIKTTGPNGSGGADKRQRRADNRTPWLPLALPLAGIVVLGIGGRKTSKYVLIGGLCMSLALVGLLVACGSSSTPGVSVTPNSAQVPLGGTQQFAASQTVTWSLSGAGAVGTISSSGLYTAPASGTTPVSFTVTATPTSGTAGSASVTIPAVGVSDSGAPTSVFPNNTGWPSQTAQFTATVANAGNKDVTWSVSTPNGGTIDANGVYTAPMIAAGLPTTVTVVATSAADGSKTGSATETLSPATVPGAYPITVTATEGTVTHTTSSFTLTVH